MTKGRIFDMSLIFSFSEFGALFQFTWFLKQRVGKSSIADKVTSGRPYFQIQGSFLLLM